LQLRASVRLRCWYRPGTRRPGIGSTYLWTMVDANKLPLEGAKTYKVRLPKDIPQANFWS
jgi:hypothetical protein